MIRLALAVAIAAAPVPTLAQADLGASYQEVAGGVSGRSPHRAYRQSSAATNSCRTVALHVPAGKLPLYGTHGKVDASCSANGEVAANDAGSRTARE